MPSWSEFQPFIVSGLALGGVYALSGVGLVVLYRATGVLNLAFGAVGAMGAFIAWSIINKAGAPGWVGWIACILFGGVLTLGYGLIFGPLLAARGPLVQTICTLGLALVLFGAMDLLWSSSGGQARSITLPSDSGGFMIGQVQVNWTSVIGLGAGIVITAGTHAFLRYTKLGTAMRAMANDREITATLGVPVRRVEAAAWFGCGLLAGIAGILLADALIARLHSIWITFAAAIVIGLVHDLITPITQLTDYRDMTPFVLAAIALIAVSRRQVFTQSREEG